MKQGISNGGGVNTAALTLGLYERGEMVDFNLFSDTGGEKKRTYAHLERLSKWCDQHGYPAIETVSSDLGSLEGDCFKHHTLPSIVVGIRSCSDKFKIRPQTKWLKEHGFDSDTTRLIGFDAGEPHRITEDTRWQLRFPLIEWGWFREDCIAIIKRHGLEVPPKSSCFFCPEMKEWEILELQREEPAKIERAIAMERNNTALVHIKGLARTHSWEQIVEYHAQQQILPLLPARAEHLPCVCFDGA